MVPAGMGHVPEREAPAPAQVPGLIAGKVIQATGPHQCWIDGRLEPFPQINPSPSEGLQGLRPKFSIPSQVKNGGVTVAPFSSLDGLPTTGLPTGPSAPAPDVPLATDAVVIDTILPCAKPGVQHLPQSRKKEPGEGVSCGVPTQPELFPCRPLDSEPSSSPCGFKP